jgi:hypothetical protein
MPVAPPPPAHITPVELDPLPPEEGLDPIDPGDPATASTGAKHRSTLLVVLDDDQEMPKSDRFEVQRAAPINVATQTGTAKLVNPGRIEDEPSSSGGEVQLPNLPKI